MSPTLAFRNMPFREKTAWAMALILTTGGALYLYWVASLTLEIGQTAPPVIPLVIAYVVIIVIASTVIMSALAIAAPREADAPADEREKLITDKAGNWSGYVMAVPVLGALWHYSVNQDGNMLFHLVFLSLMLSQIAEYTFQIVLFRRGV